MRAGRRSGAGSEPALQKGRRGEAGGLPGPAEPCGPLPRPPTFPRSDASREELAELAQQANPEEIELGEDEDEMDLEPNGKRPAGQAGWWAEAGAGPPPGR